MNPGTRVRFGDDPHAMSAPGCLCYIGGSSPEVPEVSKLRISIVEYLNTAPLVWGFTNGPLRGKYELSFTVP